MKTQIIEKKKLTGRKLVLLNTLIKQEKIFKAARIASIKLVHFNDFVTTPEKYFQAFTQGDGIYFEGLNVVVINYDKEEEVSYMKEGLARKEILATEPERYVYAIDQYDYLRGYRDGINSLLEDYTRLQTETDIEDAMKGEFRRKFIDDERASWGIKATRVMDSP